MNKCNSLTKKDVYGVPIVKEITSFRPEPKKVIEKLFVISRHITADDYAIVSTAGDIKILFGKSLESPYSDFNATERLRELNKEFFGALMLFKKNADGCYIYDEQMFCFHLIRKTIKLSWGARKIININQ